MRTCSILPTTLAATALVLSIAATSKATFIYTETFSATPGSVNASMVSFDWDVVQNVTGVVTDQSSNIANANPAANESSPNGTIGNGTQTNAGPPFGTNLGGVAFAPPTSGTVFFYTPEYNTYSGNAAGIDPAANPGLAFSWYEGNGNTDSNFRLAVKVGGQWYASATALSNPTAIANTGTFLTGASLETFTYTPTASAWDLITTDATFVLGATPGTGTANSTVSTLSLGAPATSDLVGAISAFGLFSDTPGTTASTTASTGNRRFDTFTVSNSLVAAPEPTSLGLLGVGSLLMLRRRKA